VQRDLAAGELQQAASGASASGLGVGAFPAVQERAGASALAAVVQERADVSAAAEWACHYSTPRSAARAPDLAVGQNPAHSHAGTNFGNHLAKSFALLGFDALAGVFRRFDFSAEAVANSEGADFYSYLFLSASPSFYCMHSTLSCLLSFELYILRKSSFQ